MTTQLYKLYVCDKCARTKKAAAELVEAEYRAACVVAEPPEGWMNAYYKGEVVDFCDRCNPLAEAPAPELAAPKNGPYR